MRILLALVGLAIVVLLVVLLWRPAPPPAEAHGPAPETTPPTSLPPRGLPSAPSSGAPSQPHAAPPQLMPVRTSSPMPGALLGEPPAMPGPIDAAVARAQSQERDYAYWDMKLGMLRKINQCVGDKLHTQGAAQVDYHFKRDGDVWRADRAVVRDPSDEERQKMGAVDWRGADLDVAQKCISDAFADVTMPMTGGTNELQNDYTVRGQIMFPTANDRAWKETGVNPQ